MVKYIVALAKQIKKEEYDIIHVQGSSSLMAIELITAKTMGVKTRIAHSHNTKCNYEIVDKLLRPVFNRNYTIALACGEEAGEWLFGEKKFTIVHNGRDLERFSFSNEIRETIRKKYKLDGKLAIGFVGKLNKQKNLSFLLDIFRSVYEKNNNSVLVLIGDGSDREFLQKKANILSLEENIIFTGSISNVYELIQAMDVMCLPSLYEGLPNVVLEWQIAGLPAYVSDAVTQECKVTDLVEFLPINQGTEIWAESILNTDFTRNRKMLSEVACLRMKEEMFDIKESVNIIKSIYINATKEFMK